MPVRPALRLDYVGHLRFGPAARTKRALVSWGLVVERNDVDWGGRRR